MKTLLPLIVLLSAGFVCAQAQIVAENFDQRPDPVRWKLSDRARVADGRLVLAATAPIERYATTSMISKAGDASLNFAAKPIEIEFTGIGVEGSAVPADSVFMAILTSDISNEMKARSYLKVRLSGNGQLLVTCADINGDRTRETTLARQVVTLPVRRLTLRLSRKDFYLKGLDAVRPFEQSGDLTGKIDIAAWDKVSPFLIVKGVRRPGEGEIVVTLDGLDIRAAQ